MTGLLFLKVISHAFEEKATQTVLAQAALLSQEWATA